MGVTITAGKSHNVQMWFVRSWIGIVLSSVSAVLAFFLNFTFTVFGVLSTLVDDGSLTNYGLTALIAFQTCWGFALWSYLKTMLTNPGVTPKLHPPSDLPPDQLLQCADCRQWKPPRSHHCSTCGKCVHKVTPT